MVEKQYLPNVPVPVQQMAIFYNSVAEPDRDVLKLPLFFAMTVDSVEKMDRCSCVRVGKGICHYMVEFCTWYFLDSQDTYTENSKRLLLRHG